MCFFRSMKFWIRVSFVVMVCCGVLCAATGGVETPWLHDDIDDVNYVRIVCLMREKSFTGLYNTSALRIGGGLRIGLPGDRVERYQSITAFLDELLLCGYRVRFFKTPPVVESSDFGIRDVDVSRYNKCSFHSRMLRDCVDIVCRRGVLVRDNHVKGFETLSEDVVQVFTKTQLLIRWSVGDLARLKFVLKKANSETMRIFIFSREDAIFEGSFEQQHLLFSVDETLVDTDSLFFYKMQWLLEYKKAEDVERDCLGDVPLMAIGSKSYR